MIISYYRFTLNIQGVNNWIVLPTQLSCNIVTYNHEMRSKPRLYKINIEKFKIDLTVAILIKKIPLIKRGFCGSYKFFNV